MQWYERLSPTALGTVEDSGGCSGTPRACQPGEVAICDTPTPEFLDGVMVSFPRQWVCMPEDPLEQVFPPGAPACTTPRPFRQVVSGSGNKGTWSCPHYCQTPEGYHKSAKLGPDLQWHCPSGSAPIPGYPASVLSQSPPAAPSDSGSDRSQDIEDEGGMLTSPGPLMLWGLAGVVVLSAGLVIWKLWKDKGDR